MSESNESFPIGTLTELTGVSAMTLRAWERRYGLLKPARTPKGHRLYCAHDIERVQTILSYISKGVSVGKVRSLIDFESTTPQLPEQGQDSPWRTYIDKGLAAAAAFSSNTLDGWYNELVSLYPVDVLTENCFLPLLETFSARKMAKYQNAIAEESFLINYVCNRLSYYFQQHVSQLQNEKPYFIFIGLAGEENALLRLLFAIFCLNRGYNALALGHHVALEQALIPAKQLRSNIIVATGTLSKEDCKTTKNHLDYHFFVSEHNNSNTNNVHGISADFSTALEKIQSVLANKECTHATENFIRHQ